MNATKNWQREFNSLITRKHTVELIKLCKLHP